MEVTSTLETTQLSIPLMVKYNFQKGRWQFAVKAGGLASVYTKTEVRVDKLESLNPKFRVRQQDRPEAKVTTSPKNSLDLALGIGVGYRINDRLSVLLEPTYFRQLTESNSNDFFKTTEQAAGISAGIFCRI
jgi:lipopolysaccharide assembly outer membrane protein LptD (OstA)